MIKTNGSGGREGAGIGSDGIPRLRPSPDWASLPIFDRRGWTRVRFGDVVESLNETERDPAGADIERFIGLEHLEPGSLHIRTWGRVADGTTFTRRCQPGQVLFGKRRAYQRKVAVAEFDAVVSGDIYVFAPKNDQLIPELLPFICLSERFLQYAVETSAGSLSPRTSWKHLAEFELDLPPLDQQRRIAEILWAVDMCHETTLTVVESMRCAQKSKERVLLSCGPNKADLKHTEVGSQPSTWSIKGIRDLVKTEKHSLLAGPFGTIFKAKDFRKEGVRIIQIRHITKQGFVWNENETYMDLDVYHRLHKPYTVLPGDLLITKMGEPPGIACIYPSNGPVAMVTPDVIKATIDESKADVRFLKYLYNSSTMQIQVNKLIKGGTRSRVSLNEFFRLELPIPPLEEQKKIADILDSFESSIAATKGLSNNFSKLLIECTGVLL